MSSKGAIDNYALQELDNPPGAREARERQFASEEWISASQISASYMVSLRLLRLMREAGVGPRWRPVGRSVFYSVTGFDRWLAAIPEKTILSADAEMVVRDYIQMLSRRTGAWEPFYRKCADVSDEFRLWCIGRFGTLPKGWRPELWLQLRATGRKIVWRQIEYHGKRQRAVEPW